MKMTDYERGVKQASDIYKKVIWEYVTENDKLWKLLTGYIDSFEKNAAMNNGDGPYYSGEDWLSLANDMRIELMEVCKEKNEQRTVINKPKNCPFCGSNVLYESYHNIDGFTQPVMFCNWCKAMFTVEGSEDWVSGESDGMDKLRAAWNRRVDECD